MSAASLVAARLSSIAVPCCSWRARFAGSSEEGGWMRVRLVYFALSKSANLRRRGWALLPIACACAESLGILRPVSEEVCSVTADAMIPSEGRVCRSYRLISGQQARALTYCGDCVKVAMPVEATWPSGAAEKLLDRSRLSFPLPDVAADDNLFDQSDKGCARTSRSTRKKAVMQCAQRTIPTRRHRRQVQLSTNGR